MAQKNKEEALAVRLVAGGATVLAVSVLSDSGMEHYRGSFRDPAMVLPLLSSAASIGFNARRAGAHPERAPDSEGTEISHLISTSIGIIGFGFHAYNVLKRPGGMRLVNLFYGAPVGAPVALTLAGALGKTADALSRNNGMIGPIDLKDGRVIAGVTSIGLVGTVAEAALLHFRGAYHDPFMWLPIIVPPIAAVSLARDAIDNVPRPVTTALLGTTAALGLIGVGFHAYGVARNMGGWKNWRQNLLAGPPVPTPPAFTGLAIAGLGALLLMRTAKKKRSHA
ncbi:hypothetical protein GCM10023219_02260 [Stakelama sediminis]|uniref:Uncharacterized protein n=1 Tax=Stakelama sediminis TaxID=463200 RepID=A0A840Z0V0_9SPHN|nr:hypothetical protein [Stakelama sediminis]MBB5719332.1 hypothetical protein [Stakelama sediminis]